MTAGADVAHFVPLASPLSDAVDGMCARQQRSGQWQPNQMAGRRWPVACVSLEITQRCNLDCTLCYLSESAEAVRDFPLEEIYRRIDMILAHYGPGTDVQVSGGEPTLRRRDELLAIVRRLASLGLRPCLLTNGIKATRKLLLDLCQAGLSDVAFHVDTTQQRGGYACEQDLNALRSEYVERARGLPLCVFLNTTVHAGNFTDVPMLTAWFVAHADVLRFASFQLQAETGRGVLGARADQISNHSVAQRLQQGAGVADLGFNVLAAGHRDCKQSAVLLVANGRAHDAFADAAFIQRLMRETAHLRIDRGTPWRALRALFAAPAANRAGPVAAAARRARTGADLPDQVAQGPAARCRVAGARGLRGALKRRLRHERPGHCLAPYPSGDHACAAGWLFHAGACARRTGTQPAVGAGSLGTRARWLCRCARRCPNRYPPQPAPLDCTVRFTPYDWTIANSRRAR